MRGASAIMPPGPPLPFDGGPPPSPGQMPRGQAGQNAQHWQEAYLDLEQEKRKVQGELRERSEEMNQLTREAQSLRAEIQAEQERRRSNVSELSQQLQNLEKDNKQLQMRLMKVQMQDSAKLSDVTTVKREVVEKTMELEKILREFQQTHQDKLFSRVWGLTNSMLATCQKPDVSLQIQTPVGTEESLGPVTRAGTAQPLPADDSANSPLLDPETQQALKRRLQSLGDVVVYSTEKFEACCASGRVIPPGQLRVRPRRCDHVFLVECLMPYWAEGLCPVCRCSFAFDRPHEPGFDESDRYSSVSTSVSQCVSLALQRPRGHSSSNSDGGSLRVSRAAAAAGHRTGNSMLGESHGRPASISRAAGRRNRSTSQGPQPPDTRSEASGIAPMRRGGSPSLVGSRIDPLSMSPPRSVASLQSRASSVPRAREDRGGNGGQQSSRPL